MTLLASIAAAAVIVVGWRWWIEKPAPPRWIDHRGGDGAVLSLATGHNPAGTEVLVAGGYHRSDQSGRDLRIVCFDVADGRVLWEAREDRALPNMSKVPALKLDGDGDVFAGWDYWAVGTGRHVVVTKYSGSDGRKLWEWKASASGQQSGHMAEAFPDAQGRVWVAGIQQITGGAYQRFLALLDSRNGVAHWEIPLNAAKDGGDAPIVAAPEGGEGISPWLIRRVSGADGATIWNREVTRHHDRNMFSTGFIAVGNVKSITIGGSIITGTRQGNEILSGSGGILASSSIDILTVKGSLVGNERNPVNIIAHGKALADPGFAIANVTIGGQVVRSTILTSNLAAANMQIGTVKIAGAFIASSTISEFFLLNALSRIASITIGGAIIGSARVFIRSSQVSSPLSGVRRVWARTLCR